MQGPQQQQQQRLSNHVMPHHMQGPPAFMNMNYQQLQYAPMYGTYPGQYQQFRGPSMDPRAYAEQQAAQQAQHPQQHQPPQQQQHSQHLSQQQQPPQQQPGITTPGVAPRKSRAIAIRDPSTGKAINMPEASPTSSTTSQGTEYIPCCMLDLPLSGSLSTFRL